MKNVLVIYLISLRLIRFQVQLNLNSTTKKLAPEMPGQVWGRTREQRIATSTLRRYSLGLRLAIAQADTRPAMPLSFR